MSFSSSFSDPETNQSKEELYTARGTHLELEAQVEAHHQSLPVVKAYCLPLHLTEGVYYQDNLGCWRTG